MRAPSITARAESNPKRKRVENRGMRWTKFFPLFGVCYFHPASTADVSQVEHRSLLTKKLKDSRGSSSTSNSHVIDKLCTFFPSIWVWCRFCASFEGSFMLYVFLMFPQMSFENSENLHQWQWTIWIVNIIQHMIQFSVFFFLWRLFWEK